ncbi:YuzL family protein [Priestia megaterium]|nr:YuzL family protein [Priestia megaterium]MBT2256123.1 YuzL family protein [Priestia megaterium]
MSKLKKDPSAAGVSAASVKGNAGPVNEPHGRGKKTSQNQQYTKHNTQGH